MKHEADSQVLQCIQAGERLLGHRAYLVSVQKSCKSKTTNIWSITSITSIDYTLFVSCVPLSHTCQWMPTHSFLSLSNAEKGPFMSSMVQEISLCWRSLSEEDGPHSKKIHTQKTTALVMIIKLYVALDFVWGGKFLRLYNYIQGSSMPYRKFHLGLCSTFKSLRWPFCVA